MGCLRPRLDRLRLPRRRNTPANASNHVNENEEIMSETIKAKSENETQQVAESTHSEKTQSSGLSSSKLMGDLRLNLTQPECSGPSM
jgi:hypothetical protein